MHLYRMNVWRDQAAVRALLNVEWAAAADEERPCCPGCGAELLARGADRQGDFAIIAEHEAECSVDEALREVGLASYDERESARREVEADQRTVRMLRRLSA
jgi:hypothetical protein